MGKIIKKKNEGCQGSEIWLFRDHTFGRDPRCSTILCSSAVSRFHARFSWNGSEWTIRDLGSRNGTFVVGRMLSKGEWQPVKAGDHIIFGDIDEEYMLIDDDEPRSFLITCDKNNNEMRIPLTDLLPLPSVDNPLCTVFRGKYNDFFLENENGDIVHLEHGKTFTIKSINYHVILSFRWEESPETNCIEGLSEPATIYLDIAVSPDEESAEIVLHKGEEQYVLQPKVHFYLLAYLARFRDSQTQQLMHIQQNNSNSENGWVDCNSICKDLMINREHLAQLVFRIRQEFKSCYPQIAEQIIDRHLRGKMRIGFPTGNFSVHTMS